MIKKLNIELLFWVTGLAYLALINPASDAHFSLCPIKNLGFSFCPGCGLGHSISYIFHGELKKSFESHPLGIFGLIVIISRIYTLAKRTIKTSF
ncbi:DUF2752 domain-containing protein [Pseudarcicella hirudinis]|uniref:DUF2752 domain-containing protein n=1 Tax=Pseudarcicella hirudinis TaxID=1079859 RepID=UPI000B88594E|nr:DUF2752 domain-containing protein [Pseudarcicella hirudinis]